VSGRDGEEASAPNLGTPSLSFVDGSNGLRAKRGVFFAGDVCPVLNFSRAQRGFRSR